jgi:hypothetical protein
MISFLLRQTHCRGKPGKRPKMKFHDGPHPIITVGLPTAAEAPHRHTSPTRKAGRPPIITVVLPMGTG